MKRLAEKLIPKSKLNRIIFIGGILFIFSLLGVYFAALGWIKHEANLMEKEASVVFKEDKIESLLALIDSENYTLKEKNNAIWALGVLKDERALPQLESLYTGEECNHNKDLCQYEIKKAILKIKGDFRGSWQASRE
jgi:hypothetical protein